jgi:hypothetical protein
VGRAASRRALIAAAKRIIREHSEESEGNCQSKVVTR